MLCKLFNSCSTAEFNWRSRWYRCWCHSFCWSSCCWQHLHILEVDFFYFKCECYVPNIAKRSIWDQYDIDDRSTYDLQRSTAVPRIAFLEELQMAISWQPIILSTSGLVPGCSCQGRPIQQCYLYLHPTDPVAMTTKFGTKWAITWLL